MKVINVTYNNIYAPNINNHLYPKDVWEKALSDIKCKEFWVVSKPAEPIELKDVVGRVTDFHFHEDKDSITFEIYVHQNWIDIDKMYFCLFGIGDTCLEDINKDVLTVKQFNLTGMFLADGCAWDYQVELIEEIEED